MFNFSDADLEEKTRSSHNTKVNDRITWSLTYLCQAGLAERPQRATAVITFSGLELLENPPKIITRNFLYGKYPSFKAFHDRKKGDKNSTPVTSKISEISEEDTVLIIGAGPTGLCTLQCVRLYNPTRIIVCEKDAVRQKFVKRHYPDVVVVSPEGCLEETLHLSEHGGADRVIEVAGAEDTFQLAWQAARPNAIVTVVALYDKPQVLPLPDMYGKNLTFKTGGVDGCDCDEILRLISEGKIDTTPLITHTFPFSKIEEAYDLFENRRDNVIKIGIRN